MWPTLQKKLMFITVHTKKTKTKSNTKTIIYETAKKKLPKK